MISVVIVKSWERLQLESIVLKKNIKGENRESEVEIKRAGGGGEKENEGEREGEFERKGGVKESGDEICDKVWD